MSIALQKAIKLATPFSLEGLPARERQYHKNVFGYGLKEDNKLYASDTHAVIEVSLTGSHKSGHMIPLSKEALADNAVFDSVPPMPRCFADADTYKGEIVLTGDACGKTVFKLWKDILTICKKLTKVYCSCLIEVNDKGLWVYATNDNEVGVRGKLCDGKYTKGCGYSGITAFNPEYLLKMVNALIELDPSVVRIRIDNDATKILVMADDDMRCIITNMRRASSDNANDLDAFYNESKEE